jgi:hypothetical protein
MIAPSHSGEDTKVPGAVRFKPPGVSRVFGDPDHHDSHRQAGGSLRFAINGVTLSFSESQVGESRGMAGANQAGYQVRSLSQRR